MWRVTKAYCTTCFPQPFAFGSTAMIKGQWRFVLTGPFLWILDQAICSKIQNKGSTGTFCPFNAQCWNAAKIVTHGSWHWLGLFDSQVETIDLNHTELVKTLKFSSVEDGAASLRNPKSVASKKLLIGSDLFFRIYRSHSLWLSGICLGHQLCHLSWAAGLLHSPNYRGRLQV